MANFRETFKNPHVVLPVIHVENSNQAINNSAVAISEGADGVFLISMTSENVKLGKIYEDVRQQFKNSFIGLNFLGRTDVSVFKDLTASGLWTDNAHIDENSDTQSLASLFWEKKKQAGYDGLYFGGVAHKYQRPVAERNLAIAAVKAIPYMDVITTSGLETGEPPTVEKIHIMKGAIGDFPLAIDSGMSPDNVRNYLAADCFLVASSLFKPGKEDFDPIKLRDFVQTVRG